MHSFIKNQIGGLKYMLNDDNLTFSQINDDDLIIYIDGILDKRREGNKTIFTLGNDRQGKNSYQKLYELCTRLNCSNIIKFDGLVDQITIQDDIFILYDIEPFTKDDSGKIVIKFNIDANTDIDQRLNDAFPNSKIDIKFIKYLNMLKNRIPEGAVKIKCKQEGITDEEFEEIIAIHNNIVKKPTVNTTTLSTSLTDKETAVNLPPYTDYNKSYTLYLNMLKRDVPEKNVFFKCKRDNFDVDILKGIIKKIGGISELKKYTFTQETTDTSNPFSNHTLNTIRIPIPLIQPTPQISTNRAGLSNRDKIQLRRMAVAGSDTDDNDEDGSGIEEDNDILPQQINKSDKKVDFKCDLFNRDRDFTILSVDNIPSGLKYIDRQNLEKKNVYYNIINDISTKTFNQKINIKYNTLIQYFIDNSYNFIRDIIDTNKPKTIDELQDNINNFVEKIYSNKGDLLCYDKYKNIIEYLIYLILQKSSSNMLTQFEINKYFQLYKHPPHDLNTFNSKKYEYKYLKYKQKYLQLKKFI